MNGLYYAFNQTVTVKVRAAQINTIQLHHCIWLVETDISNHQLLKPKQLATYCLVWSHSVFLRGVVQSEIRWLVRHVERKAGIFKDMKVAVS